MRISRIVFWVLACLLPVTIALTVVTGVSGPSPYFAFGTVVLWLINPALFVIGACMVSFERGQWRGLMMVGMSSAILALVVWSTIFGRLFIMWESSYPDVRPLSHINFIVATFFTSLAVYCAMASFLMLIRLGDRASRIMRTAILLIGTIALVHINAAVAAFPAVECPWQQGYVERHLRWGSIWVILIATGSLACVGSHHLSKFRKGEEEIVPRVPIRLTCPRCSLAQQMQTEGDVCARCGLRVKVSMVNKL